MMTRAVAVCLAVLAAGCMLRTSQPARLFVLDAVATTSEPGAGAPGPVLGVLRVSVPDWLGRPEITARAANGRIAPDEIARWGEPLARGIQRVVAENLARLLPDRQVARAPFPPRQALDHRLEIAVTEAARQGDGTVLLEARWGILGRDGAVFVQRRSSHRAGPARDAATTVRGLNEALAALSGEIAEALRALPPPDGPPGPQR
jgi:uncharacterized lipoprotein YmbA